MRTSELFGCFEIYDVPTDRWEGADILRQKGEKSIFLQTSFMDCPYRSV